MFMVASTWTRTSKMSSGRAARRAVRIRGLQAAPLTGGEASGVSMRKNREKSASLDRTITRRAIVRGLMIDSHGVSPMAARTAQLLGLDYCRSLFQVKMARTLRPSKSRA
jgi:hypothetical protein